MAMLWILNLSDGGHSLLDIAERADLPFTVVRGTAQRLQQHGLLTLIRPDKGTDLDICDFGCSRQ